MRAARTLTDDRTPPVRRSSARLGGPVVLAAVLACALALLFTRSAPSDAGPTCTKSWASAVDGHWANPALWSPAGVPTMADDVCITVTGTYTVTLTQAQMANSLQLGSAGAGTASLTVEGVGCSFSSSLTVTTTSEVFARGRLTLGSSGCAGAQSMFVGSGGLVNDGSVESLAANGGTRFLRAGVVNRGTVTISTPTSFDQSGTTFDNQGTLATADTFTVTGGATIVGRSGAITSSGTGHLLVSGSTFDQRGGKVDGALPAEVLNGTFNDLGTGSPAAVVLHQSGTLTGAIASGQTVVVEGVGCAYPTTITATGAVANAGTLRLTSGGCGGTYAQLVGSGLLTNTGTIDVAAGNGGDRYLRMSVRNQGVVTADQTVTYDQGGSTFDNRGSVVATQPVNVSSAFTNTSGSIASSGAGQVRVVGAGTFTQANASTTGNPVEVVGTSLSFATPSTGSARFVMHSSGTLAGNIPASAAVTIEGLGCSYNTTVTAAGSFTNAGTVRLTSGGCGGTYAQLVGPGLLTNTGTIDVAAGNGGDRFLRMDVRNQGTVKVDEPLTYDQGGATFTNLGTIALSQPMAVANGTLRNDAGSIDGTGAGQITVTGSGVFRQGDGNTSGNAVVIEGAALAFLSPSTGTSSFVAHSSATLSGDIPSGATFTIQGLGCSYNTTVTAAGSFTNAGTIAMTSGGCGGTYAQLTGPGLITNMGTISVDAGNGGDRFLRMSVLNQGTTTIDEPLTYDGSGTTFTNQGTVTLTQPMTATNATVRNESGSIDGSGVGRVSASTGATFQQGDGDVTGNPAVIEGSTLVFLSPSTGTSSFVAHSSVGLSGDIPSGATLTIEGLGCSYNTSVTATGPFTNAGTIAMTSGGCGGTYALLAGPGVITNTGTISVDPGNGGARYLRADVVNQGTVTVDEPLSYDSAGTTFTNQGTVTLTQPMTASATTVRNLSGSIDGSGLGQLSAASGARFEQGNGDVTGNPAVIVSSDLAFLSPSTGSSSFVAHASVGLTGDIPSGATLTIEGLGCSYNTAVSAAASFTNEGTIAFTSGGCGGTSAALNVSGSLANAGTIVSEPGNGGTRSITATTVDNTGTIHLESGVPLSINGGLDLQAGGTLLVDVDGIGSNGRVAVTGPVTFGGALETNTSFTPPFGATFQVATYTSPSGSFGELGTTGTQYSPTYGPTALTISVLKASATSLTAGPAGPTVSGQAVTFTATIAVVLPDTGTPTGQVEFFDGPTSLGTAPIDGSSHASLTVADLPVGTHHVTAEYLGAATFGHSTSSPVTRVVTKASTAVILVSDPNPSSASQNVTFTATVGVVAPGTGMPTGTVTFKEGATILGTGTVGATGDATFTTPSLHVGTHTVTASYAGDGSFGASTSNSVSQGVQGVAVATTTTLHAPTGVIATQAFDLTATVAVVGSTGAPSGDVEFRDGTTVLGTAGVRASGDAVLRLPRGLGGGEHHLTAAYQGTVTIDPSTSPDLTLTVGKAQVTFAVTAELDPTKRGVVRFIVAATVKAPASAAPAGPVVLRDGDVQVAEGRLVDGRAVLTRCFIPACEEPPPTTTTTTIVTTTSTSSTTTSSTSTSTSSTTTTTEEPTTTIPVTTIPATTIPSTTTTTEGRPVPDPVRVLVASPAPAVPAVPVVAPDGMGGALDVRVASTRQLVASYPGDADFAAYDSDPIPVQVDGDTVTLPEIVPPTTTTQPPVTTTVVDPPPPPPNGPPTGTPNGPGGTGTTGGTGGSTGIAGTGGGTIAQLLAPPGGGTGIDGTTDPTGGVGLFDPNGIAAGSKTGADGGVIAAAAAGGSTSASGSGTVGNGGSQPQSLSAEYGRSTLSSSTATPKEVSTDPTFVMQNLVLTLFLLLLSTYPAYLFNSTLAENYDEVMGWMGPMQRRMERLRAARGRWGTPVVLGLSAVVGALLFGLLDPNLGWNMPSLALLTGLAASIILVSAVYDVARARFLRRNYGIESSLRAYPAGLVVAAILVLFSRVAHFTPGYLFGVFTALGFSSQVDKRKDGKGVAVAALWLLAMATACWFLWVPVSEAAGKPHAGFVPLFLDATLATTWVVGVQSVVFGLMPLRFLDGEKVKAWSRTGWAALYALGMFAFVHSMIRPGTKVDGDSFYSAMVLFVGFTVFAVSFWAYFRLRIKPDEGASPPADGPDDKELVDA